MVAPIFCFCPLFLFRPTLFTRLEAWPRGIYRFETMPTVTRDTRGDGHSGLSTPITALVCIASVATALTLGRSPILHDVAAFVVTDLRLPTLAALAVLAWKFIIWRRNERTPPTSTSAKLFHSSTFVIHLPWKPEPTHLVRNEKDRAFATKIPPIPPADCPGPMKNPPAKKSIPTLKLDVSCDAEATQQSPLRSASFNPVTKTQSVSSRTSKGAKKLYVDFSRWDSHVEGLG